MPILGNQNNSQNANVGVGAVNTGGTVGAIVDDRNDEGGDGIGNIQVAGAESGDVEGGNNSATTNVGGSAGSAVGISNSHSASNTATAGGNIANNSSNSFLLSLSTSETQRPDWGGQSAAAWPGRWPRSAMPLL